MYITKQDLPISSLPKQGEEVTWFSQNTINRGTLKGYDSENRPMIINEFGNPDQTNDMFSVRPSQPNLRIKPNWNRIPNTGKIITPTFDLNAAIIEKLNQIIPPGPTYLELINEMYQRGYETYLVGGTVRDFIQGDPSNDIDIVTSMPLKSSIPLIKSMFANNFSFRPQNGYIRVGGSPSTGDPFIDIKNFYVGLGGHARIYGSEITDDYKVRDFACNSVYFDPINNQIIDPTGIGFDDALRKKLTITKDLASNTAKSNAQILIRFIKFSIRGYNYSEETLQQLKTEICPMFRAMSQGEKVDYINRQIINKSPIGKSKEHFEKFIEKFSEIGILDFYNEQIRPIEKLIKTDR
jgi:hypothetical protein